MPIETRAFVYLLVAQSIADTRASDAASRARRDLTELQEKPSGFCRRVAAADCASCHRGIENPRPNGLQQHQSASNVRPHQIDESASILRMTQVRTTVHTSRSVSSACVS
jgi:hypothetical protein